MPGPSNRKPSRPALSASEEHLKRRSASADPRAEPDSDLDVTRDAGAPPASQGHRSGPAPATSSRIAELERLLEEARAARKTAEDRCLEHERTIERLKRDHAVDQTKVNDLSAELPRLEARAKEAIAALDTLARALERIEEARIEAGDARTIAYDALGKMIG